MARVGEIEKNRNEFLLRFSDERGGFGRQEEEEEGFEVMRMMMVQLRELGLHGGGGGGGGGCRGNLGIRSSSSVVAMGECAALGSGRDVTLLDASSSADRSSSGSAAARSSVATSRFSAAVDRCRCCDWSLGFDGSTEM